MSPTEQLQGLLCRRPQELSLLKKPMVSAATMDPCRFTAERFLCLQLTHLIPFLLPPSSSAKDWVTHWQPALASVAAQSPIADPHHYVGNKGQSLQCAPARLWPLLLSVCRWQDPPAMIVHATSQGPTVTCGPSFRPLSPYWPALVSSFADNA